MKLVNKLLKHHGRSMPRKSQENKRTPAPNLSHLSWNGLKTDYEHLLENLLTHKPKSQAHIND